ncbi:hypothetical protein SARC_16614 [Sphaeroforma arctica JP610]|uniref:Uncharacterized protein n=1 Tax=Sphaeroforma arctica JP610 TaxID=667725 RepID=A0A0L0F2L7_9EUKA|nr:hypothetical protein SARC_16614 [Sphaeroforma arctica JP610]KNC70854.1 hypothetical protein SARC_16614 [Sphaeroforma arctica JP610]|eukprot:XP_014144756.1 hypothetical protein SARC_16614 [Sphaeroforma arctica JP610]
MVIETLCSLTFWDIAENTESQKGLAFCTVSEMAQASDVVRCLALASTHTAWIKSVTYVEKEFKQEDVKRERLQAEIAELQVVLQYESQGNCV